MSEHSEAEAAEFPFEAACDHLKKAGSISAWKKSHKDEHQFWSHSSDFDELLEKAGVEAKAKKKKPAVVQPVKVTVSSPNALALGEVLKDRGLKKFDLSDVIDEALEAVPEEWWAQKKEELTPLEWKIQQISQNPDLKSKLADQLDQLLAEAKSSSVH